MFTVGEVMAQPPTQPLPESITDTRFPALNVTQVKSFQRFEQDKLFMDMLDKVSKKVSNIEKRLNVTKDKQIKHIGQGDIKKVAADNTALIKLLQKEIDVLKSIPPKREFYIKEKADTWKIIRNEGAKVAVSVLLAYFINKYVIKSTIMEKKKKGII